MAVLQRIIGLVLCLYDVRMIVVDKLNFFSNDWMKNQCKKFKLPYFGCF